MSKELFVRIISVDGVESGGNEDEDECFCEAVIDGERRRCLPGIATGEGYEWRSAVGGGVAWRMDETGLRRLQAHEPRLRIDVIKHGMMIGFAHFDLRTVPFAQGSGIEVRKPLQRSSYTDASLRFEISMRPVAGKTKQDDLHDLRLSLPSAAEADLDIGVAIGDEHVLIGSAGDTDFTLYITLLNVSGLRHLQQMEKGRETVKGNANTYYWIRYHIFGVQIDTETFQSLKFPKFAPIRDSFQIRSSTNELADFLQSAPIRITLCKSEHKTGSTVDVRKQGKPQIMTSTLMHFDSLFSNGVDFVQATCNCAFPFEPHDPFKIQTTKTKPGLSAQIEGDEDDHTVPSIAVGLELHELGKVEKVVPKEEDNGAVEVVEMPSPVQSPRKPSNMENVARSPGTNFVKVRVRHFDLDPLDDEEAENVDDDTTTFVSISLICWDADGQETRVTSKQSFQLDEYGQLDQCDVPDVELLKVPKANRGVMVQCFRMKDQVVIGRAEIGELVSKKIPLLNRNGVSCGSVFVHVEQGNEMESFTKAPTLNDGNEEGVVYDYRMTVDLRSVKGLDQQSFNVYLQYSYPLFGTSQTIQTRPPILIDRFSERVIPHGLKMFQFQSTRERLDNAAQSEPLVIEMWHKDQYTSDMRLGFCALPLRKLLDSRPYFKWAGQTFATYSALEIHRDRILSHQATSMEDATGLATARRTAERIAKQMEIPIIQVQVLEATLPICSFGADGSSTVKRIANVKCMCTLETVREIGRKSTKQTPMGAKVPKPISSPALSPIEQKKERHATTVVEPLDLTTTDDEDHTPTKPQSSNNKEIQDDLVTAAWKEFQEWKENQTRQWEIEMQTRETARMAELEQEWAIREHERTVALKQAQVEFEQLSQRMHRAINDAERRERALIQHKTELDQVARQRMSDLEVLNRRAREECDHQVQLHKTKALGLEEETKRLRTALGQSEKRLAKTEEDFAMFKEKMRQSSEAELQREIARLQGVVAELNARIEQEKERTMSETMAKEATKAQLVQVARELQSLRKKDSLRAERELDKLRLEYLAREERFVLDGDRHQLQDMRRELNELRAATLRQPYVPPQIFKQAQRDINPATDRRTPSPPPPPPPSDDHGSPELEDQIHRLEKEKRELLDTGLYEPDHPILEQLDRHIELARKKML